MQGKQALEGIRIIAFSWIATLPLATQFLAYHGAEVIKVECHRRPDETRGGAPFKDNIPGINRSGLFDICNNGKYGITLNLNHPQGPEYAKKLISTADVVAESFTPGTMKRWGLNYEELKQVKSDIIAVSLSMHGQDGPYSSLPILGTYLQGAMGFTNFVGWPDREPTGTQIPYPDTVAPWFLIVAIIAALLYRRQTGEGQYIDLSQFESSIPFLAPALMDYAVNGREQTRMGNKSYTAPHGVFRCKGEDRWCAIAVTNDEEWKAFCRVINADWQNDPKFSTLIERKKNEDELERLIEAWTINHTTEEIMKLMQDEGVPAGIVQSNRDLLENDPQLQHRHHFHKLNHTEIGEYNCELPPFKLSETPAEVTLASPCIGEHNEYVWTKIAGLSDKEFVELLELGVLE